jgi:hypothetical protein
MSYIERTLERVIRRAAREFPVVVLTGPRQSGKTTLLKHLFAKNHRYVSLEAPDVWAAAAGDPRGFLESYPPPVVFDEVQYAPALLPYIKERVDADRGRAGQYILTGSQNLLVVQGITESLAGRAAMLRLLPMSYREVSGIPHASLPWERRTSPRRKGPVYEKLWESFLRGGYPEMVANPKRDAALWHASYVQTYLERDVRSLRQIGDLGQFQLFLRALATRSAQLLSLADLSRDLGIALNTARAWLSILEATYQVIVLRPYFANVGRRLVKTPKVYFGDVGTLCYLAGLRDPAHAMAGPMGGAIMETAVVSEIVRTLTHAGREPQIYFWRTSTGTEVDLVVDTGTELIPIEVKLSTTPNRNMAKGIEAFRRDFGKRAAKGYVVHPGDVKLPLGPDASACPFAEL